MAMTKKEILQSAKQLEVDGRDFYIATAEKTTNELSRKMFLALADDELTHMKWIDAHSPGGYTAHKANKETYDRLKNIFAEVPEQTKKSAEASENDISALNTGIEMEIKSRDAYSKFAKESEDEEIRKLFKELRDIEQFHYELLLNTKEYFEKTADWFMVEERWSFNGG
jgi:rubrerythrin